ncbi:hypothetical protein [Desulfatibacillum aliphaticivorans]|uniref:Uncharacterized protein n=1 Tax=Desulfatibacillum aliphaticivorans TaxID=218208 RepID=B8FEH7_DESAL|nr:hypothetical protein [Desulfatibacillum aliphaticivorans]ACL06958.1 hypothetical protein Dalk_5289 [Desulfatibacillum aliphaticivorans]
MDMSSMNRDELFMYVEGLIKQKGYSSVTETWRQIAARIQKDDPEFAAFLCEAEDNWDDAN